MFSWKICRSCGDRFNSDNEVCDFCLDEFRTIENELKSSDHSEYLKYCKYCGRPFIAGYVSKRKVKSTGKISTFFQPSRSEYCKGIDDSKIHYTQCQNCGGAVKVDLSGGWPNKVGCSRKCTSVIHQKKWRATNLERYGVEIPIQSKEIQEKMRKTCLEKYGVEYVLSKGYMRDKIDEKFKEKYGYDNASQVPEIKDRIRRTNMEKYGGTGLASPILARNYRDVSRERYGTDYPHQSDEIKKKITEGLYRRHAETIQDPVKRKNYLDFISDPIQYIQSHFESRPTLKQVSESLDNFDQSTIYFYIGEGKSRDLFSYIYSKMEDDVQKFLESHNIVYLPDCRTVISPKELDLYIPSYGLGIECNPTATHNSSLPYISDSNGSVAVDKNYHKVKSNLCAEKGVFLFHIFGYEWRWKQDIVKSMILNLLGECSDKYYARNLTLHAISQEESKSFLNRNHRQGFTNAKIRLGLKDKDGKLVSLMTFDKIRHTIGNHRDDTEDSWELSRFCNLLNTSVVGGASKLFKYFLKNYRYDKIISFSDRAHTRGNLYEILGFEKVSISEPNYVWVRMSDDIYYNRVSCQKKNLPKLLNEPDLDIENQTEKQIMIAHGFVQVFDSGNIRWEYTKH